MKSVQTDLWDITSLVKAKCLVRLSSVEKVFKTIWLSIKLNMDQEQNLQANEPSFVCCFQLINSLKT